MYSRYILPESEKARPGSPCRVLLVPYRDGACGMVAVFIEVKLGRNLGADSVYTVMIQLLNLWLKILL